MKSVLRTVRGGAFGSYLYIAGYGLLGALTACTTKGEDPAAGAEGMPPASQSLDNPGELDPKAAPVGGVEDGSGAINEPATPPEGPIGCNSATGEGCSGSKAVKAAKGKKAAAKKAAAKKPASAKSKKPAAKTTK